MAAMTTVLKEYSTNGDSRTYTCPTHTVSKRVLFLQRRKAATGNQVIAEDTVSVVHGTEDSVGAALPQSVLFSVTVRRPITGIAADRTAALALFREFIASDNFDGVITGQDYVQG